MDSPVDQNPREGQELSESIGSLDPLLLQRVRLAICVLLCKYQRISFARLKSLTNESDGNLGANLRKLEAEGYLDVEKKFEDRKPISWYQLTDKGLSAVESHLAQMQLIAESVNQ